MSDATTGEFLALQEALVGRYSLQSELGRGGMGIVFLAHDVALDRPVALKLLPPALSAQPSLRQRFLREARTAARLTHPNIVPIHGVEEVGTFVFYVMAYVDGETLESRVRSRGPLAPSEAARVLREVAWALAYAHAHGVVHRDVKPANVLLDRETGRAMVMDFGIAQVGSGPGLTAIGEVLGTAEFMSPEQASGEVVDERSDVYSMGILGYFLLAGRLPFQGSTVAATLAQHLTQAPPPLTKAAPHVPNRLARVVDRCLMKDRGSRFPGGDELARELGRALDERREIPVPVRSFLDQTVERFEGISGWLIAGGYFLVASVAVVVDALSPVVLLPMLAVGAVLVFLAGTMVLAPAGLLVRMVRALLRTGYDRRDVVAAWEARIQERQEARELEIGSHDSWLDRLGERIVIWGLGSMAMGTVLASTLNMRELAQPLVFGVGGLILGGALVTLAGMPLAAMKMGRGKREPGERWLKFWKSAFGAKLFDFAGIGIEPPAAGPGHRPTEMVIGTAADRLFHSLPDTFRRELRELPEVVRKLEANANAMRAQSERLSQALTELDEAPAREPSPERTRLREDLERAREQARGRASQAMSALETIRLGLLRLHAGEGSVQRLTAELGTALEVSEQIARLTHGQAEVRDL